jgi:protein-tyrosine phosphatase
LANATQGNFVSLINDALQYPGPERNSKRHRVRNKMNYSHEKKTMKAILFVCMGNICRSPAAEGIFKKLVIDAGRESEFEIDSAGTIGYHVGHRSDRRMRSAALKRGYQLDSLARLIQTSDFDQFDLIIAMDDDNFRDLQRMSPGSRATVVRMCDYCETSEVSEVPDPYYGGKEGFVTVIDILEDACANLLKKT